MKLTLEELKSADEALRRLFNTPMPLAAAKEVTEAMEIIEAELKEINNKEEELLQVFGMDHPTHNGVRIIHPDKEAEYNVAFNAFLAENEIDDKAKFGLSTFGNIQISPRDLKALDKFIQKEV
jgi:hypothetical protein